ncbi:MAG TPA: ATP-binding cassette domain-containing protein [Stellaceae bacterium]|nr:ATP-binding cassette domain-containing protein [Stellaceae bacterium]
MDDPLVSIEGVSKSFGASRAIDGVSATIAAGRITGLVGPDGAGKSTLLRLMDGLLKPDAGRILVLGHDSVRAAPAIHLSTGYMPQRFGLYADLTVHENLTLYADLRGVTGAERRQAFEQLLGFTGLAPFQSRLAGNLSGGMKQKLGLACTLVRKPRVLLLDEPSVGVDPISRRELWRMITTLVDDGTAVVWSTSYLDEAERCDEVLLLHEGKALYAGPPQGLTRRAEGCAFLVELGGEIERARLGRLLRRPDVSDFLILGRAVRLVLKEAAGSPPPDLLAAIGATSARAVAARFEDAYVALLGGAPAAAEEPAPIAAPSADRGTVIEARDLTKRFGSFVAADRITFQIRRGEIFGLLGPNGAGKSTTFKMMCGLLRPTSGAAQVAGVDLIKAGSLARRRIGYMAQKFSLYGDLSVRQNLDFFAGVYGIEGRAHQAATERMVARFALEPYLDAAADQLPLGFKQRLALACAVMHEPAVLFLDEPTSGVDPLTRREFWRDINEMVARGITIMVTTHFLDEAEYCDRIALVFAGRVIALGSPAELKAGVAGPALPEPTLEDAFITLVERSGHAKAA